ncbi:MAG: tetratricopeptide repeat protein [Paracoccaceae bacterium]
MAQYNLGIMHSFGLGVVPDYKASVKWYTRAAEQGDPIAQYNLARLYYLGQGVKENLAYAHMWANHASSNGFEMGEELKGLLTELMSPSQIEKAQNLANECLKKAYQGC